MHTIIHRFSEIWDTSYPSLTHLFFGYLGIPTVVIAVAQLPINTHPPVEMWMDDSTAFIVPWNAKKSRQNVDLWNRWLCLQLKICAGFVWSWCEKVDLFWSFSCFVPAGFFVLESKMRDWNVLRLSWTKVLNCRSRCKTTCIKYISYGQVIDTRDVFSNCIVWGVDAICCIMSNASTVVVCQHKHLSSAPLNLSVVTGMQGIQKNTLCQKRVAFFFESFFWSSLWHQRKTQNTKKIAVHNLKATWRYHLGLIYHWIPPKPNMFTFLRRLSVPIHIQWKEIKKKISSGSGWVTVAERGSILVCHHSFKKHPLR